MFDRLVLVIYFTKPLKKNDLELTLILLVLGILLSSPLLDCPVPVGQHLWADLDDTS